MSTTQTAGTCGPRIPLVSTCPRCRYVQAQWYRHSVLRRLLDRGLPVEGYCAMCDLFWPISARERDGLAVKLALNRRSAEARCRPLLNVVRLATNKLPTKDDSDKGAAVPKR
jgi:hypothetical protein